MAKKTLNKVVETPEKKANPELSREDLEKIAIQLRADNNYLNERCAQAEQIISEFNEIGMLLSLLEKSEHFEASFTSRCANRIQKLISEALDIAEEREAAENAKKEAARKGANTQKIN